MAAVTTATTFAPWGRSGTRTRSSYAIIDIVERAGVLSPAAARLSAAWFFVPALCGVVLVAGATRRVRLEASAAASLGLLVAVGAVLVARSPLVTEPGAILGALTGACTTVAGVIALVVTIKRRMT